MEERRCEAAFWGLGRVFVRKCHFEFELPIFPNCLVFPWDGAFPFLEIEDTSGCAHRPCDETKGVVFPPLFSLFIQPVLAETHGGEL